MIYNQYKNMYVLWKWSRLNIALCSIIESVDILTIAQQIDVWYAGDVIVDLQRVTESAPHNRHVIVN